MNADIGKYHMERIEFAARNAGSLEAVKGSQGVGKIRSIQLKTNKGV